MALSLCLMVIATFVALIGVLVVSSPSGVSPPVTPPGSTTSLLPPWPIFRVAVSVNEFFEAAAIATRPPPVRVKNLATAYWQSEITYSLVKSGIIEELGRAGGGGGMACGGVASKLKLNSDFTCRIMRAGEGLQLLTASGSGEGLTFALAVAGDMLRKEHPGSLTDFVLMINEESRDAWRAAGTDSLRTGVSGFKSAYGEEFFDWHMKPDHSRQMVQFDGSMKSFSHEFSGSLLLDWAPPVANAVVCDVGGGVGHMLAAMGQHYPELSGILFDLPPVAERAKENFDANGLGERFSSLGGSFWDPLPKKLAACDVFYLKFVLHDWADSQNVQILKNIAAVAKPGAKIVTTDFIMGIDGAAMETAKKMMDINMLANCVAGARERTYEEYMSLFPAAGIHSPPKLIKLRDLASVVEVTL